MNYVRRNGGKESNSFNEQKRDEEMQQQKSVLFFICLVLDQFVGQQFLYPFEKETGNEG